MPVGIKVLDKNLLEALKKSQSIVLRTLYRQKDSVKYEKIYNLPIGRANSKRKLRLSIIIDSSKEFPYQYSVEFINYQMRTIKGVCYLSTIEQAEIENVFYLYKKFAFI